MQTILPSLKFENLRHLKDEVMTNIQNYKKEKSLRLHKNLRSIMYLHNIMSSTYFSIEKLRNKKYGGMHLSPIKQIAQSPSILCIFIIYCSRYTHPTK